MFHFSRARPFLLPAIAVTLLLPSRWWASVGAAGVTRAGVADTQVAPAQTFEGTLLIVWGDPRPDSGAAGETRFTLALPDGRQLPLQMTGQEHVALSYFGKPVVVSGRLAARPSAVAGAPDPEIIVVDSIGPSQTPAAAADQDPSAAVSGTKKVLYLLLKFSDDAAVPHPPSFFTNLTNPDTPPSGEVFPATINGFFKKTSSNQFSWVGEVGGAGGIGASGGWLTLPKRKADYAPCDFSVSCLDITALTNDSIAAGTAAGISFVTYDNINFVYSNDLDCCARGGNWFINGKLYGTTWEPPWGQETTIYAHEMGHSLGLPHSGWVYFAYDSPWDVMSGYSDLVITNCGSYLSRNNGGALSTLKCGEPGNGYIAAHKDYLGWIPPANAVVTDTASTVNVTLEGAALPLGSGTRMIKICLPGFSCSGVSARYFTVEARVKGGGTTTLYDNGIPGEGIIIHDVQFGRPAISGPCYFNGQSGWAVPVDATPGDYNSVACNAGGRAYPNYALYNAQFTQGQTYTNSTYHFSVAVVSRTGSNFVVSVTGTSTSDITLDSPSNGSVVGRPFTTQGWALNKAASSGTGVDTVHVYAFPTDGSAASFLGVATYGTSRPDIGALFGAQFTNCGFTLTAGGSLSPGSYTVIAYAHNALTNSFDATRSASITIPAPVSHPLMNIDTPAPSATVTSAFEVGGWAIDAAAASGTGVDAVQFYVFPNDGASPGVFIGTGSYGRARTDVGGAFGSQFTNSGFHFTITGLGPGNYLLGVYGHSTVTNAFSVIKTVHFTVNAFALMSIDVPSGEAIITSPTFSVAGWAMDRKIESVEPFANTTGVDTLHVYAFPNPGSGQPAIFLGVATVNIPRGDVAGFYGSRYTNSGYSLNVNAAAAGLTPGVVYNIVVWAHSTVSASFNNAAVVRVTIQ